MPQFDQLAFMNAALLATGNTQVTTDDGSAEWVAAEAAFDRAFNQVLDSHDWHFQSKINSALTRVGGSPYPGFTDVYAKPADCLFLQQVWRPDLAQWVMPIPTLDFGRQGARPPSLDYQIIGGQIHTVAPDGVAAIYIETTNAGAVFPPLFIEAVIRQMESLIFQSLNEDYDAAAKVLGLSQQALETARARNDQENPRKVLLKSNMLQRRRYRSFGGWL